MRRISRVNRSIDLLRARATAQTSSPYLCLACRHRASSFSTSSLRSAQKDEKVPITERIRQRIWGTDQPPGQVDPYGGASVFDKTKERSMEKALAEREASSSAGTIMSPDYAPADNWDGLDHVGGYGGWWKQNWDPEHQFQGFLPAEVVTDPEERTAALHRALVEVFALKKAGVPLQDISKSAPGIDITHDIQILPTANGAVLTFSEETSLEKLVQSLRSPVINETATENAPTESEEDVAADRSVEDPLHPTPEPIEETSEKGQPTESEEDVAADRSEDDPLHHETSQRTYEDLLASWDPSWTQVSIEDPEVKFAVMKRTLQLTGARLPDSAIRSAKTAKGLLSHLVAPPKPRKVAEALVQKEELLNLPNVKVYAQRITPIDREKEVGRWKLIEKELESRGLPVTGH
ncbi:hypothetical protein G7Y89_g2130 [Cudoniella acicularis]|uniref:Large ribosomal subunit protein mL50 n=1 Tax=Cudoniella acicularis TaxID=354080 RepID=A0A8H4RU04_9HELO|nr:hypothetical protein G7Y89_g2130 [Cudoniella acicularis]